MSKGAAAVRKCLIIALVLTVTATAYILLHLIQFSSLKIQLHDVNTSSPLASTTATDARLSAQNTPSKISSVSTTTHIIATTASPAVCNGQCVPCSKMFSSCQDVIAAESHLRPKRQYKRKVILSTDVKNLFFTWFVPIVSLLWYEKMEWQPVILIVYLSEEDFTLQINLIIKYAIASGIEVHKYKHTLPTSKYPMKVSLTAVRFGACVFDWPEDTYILTSDVDMWPLSADFYNKETYYNSAVHILYANGYGNPKSASEYAACYIGMKLSTWREVMKCHKGQDMMSFVAELRDFEGGNPWGIDQRGFTKRLKQWNGFPNNVHFTSRNPRFDRIDRKYHKNNYVWTPQKVEAHVFRPAFTAENWPRIRAILSHVLDQEQMEWVDGYAEHICSLLSCVNASLKDSYGVYRY